MVCHAIRTRATSDPEAVVLDEATNARRSSPSDQVDQVDFGGAARVEGAGADTWAQARLARSRGSKVHPELM